MGMQNLYFPGKPVVWGAGAQAGRGERGSESRASFVLGG